MSASRVKQPGDGWPAAAYSQSIHRGISCQNPSLAIYLQIIWLPHSCIRVFVCVSDGRAAAD